jgi:hypothetical protein
VGALISGDYVLLPAHKEPLMQQRSFLQDASSLLTKIMTITPAAGTITDRRTNASTSTFTVASAAPYVFVMYNLVTKTIVGLVQYRKGSLTGGTTTKGGIIACDTYANLQEAVTVQGLIGTLSKDPTPKAASRLLPTASK